MHNGKRISSAILTLVLSIILIAGSIAGCSKKEKVQTEPKTQIVLWYYWDLPYQKQTLSDLVEAFNQSQDKIEVSAKYIPDAEFRKEFSLGIVDGEAPDIALLDSADFQYFNALQPFVPLDGEIRELDAYMPAALEPCTIEGRIMGLPCGLNCTALFYNKNMLEAAGIPVPATWDDLYQAARLMSKDGTYGYGQSALQSEESLYAFLPMLWSLGGDVDDINSENSRKAFGLLKSLAQCQAMNRQSISLTGSDLAGQFAEGNVAMMINGMGMVDFIREQNPELNFGVGDIPSQGEGASVTGGEIFGVTDGENKTEAITFLLFVCEKDRMESYIDNLDMLAPREDILRIQYQDDAVMRQFTEIFAYARNREFTKEWPEVSAVISKAIEEIIIGERDMDEVLQEAEIAIQTIREDSE